MPFHRVYEVAWSGRSPASLLGHGHRLGEQYLNSWPAVRFEIQSCGLNLIPESDWKGSGRASLLSSSNLQQLAAEVKRIIVGVSSSEKRASMFPERWAQKQESYLTKSIWFSHLSTEQSSTLCIALPSGKEGSQTACWEQLLLHGDDAGKITPGIMVHDMDNCVPMPGSMPRPSLLY